MTKHQIVEPATELKVGDSIIVKGEWAEIYHITEDSGINTSRGWICRTEIQRWQVNPDLPVYIVCAANRKTETGRIICGARHCDTIMREQIKAAEGLDYWIGGVEQGFIDQYGRFWNRQEAWIIAEKAGQIRYQVSTPGTLYSENCW